MRMWRCELEGPLQCRLLKLYIFTKYRYFFGYSKDTIYLFDHQTKGTERGEKIINEAVLHLYNYKKKILIVSYKIFMGKTTFPWITGLF